MRVRLATALAALFLAIVSIAIQHHAGASIADGVCPNGSNWDNFISACR